MKPSIELYLITSTTCNLRCKSCPGGRKDTAYGGTMSLAMLRRILEKSTGEARVNVVQLFCYNEPFLIPHLPGMVSMCHEFRLPVLLSTNLNVFKHAPAILAACPDRLLISVSGWTQRVYVRSHRGGDIETVKGNMAKVAKLRSPKTEVQVSWHCYRYNEHERPLMEAYANRLGFGFNAYATSLLPTKRAMKVWETGITDPAGEDLLIPVEDAKEMCRERRHWDCSGQDSVVFVNSDGTLWLCNSDAGYDPTRARGNLFDTTIPAFLKARKGDPECAACKLVGGHIYTMQAYTRAEWSPMRLAGTLCRRLGIDGLVQPMVRRLYGRRLLPKG